MKRIRALLLSVGLPALSLLGLMLFAAVPAAAQEDDYHLVPVNRQAIEYHTGCYDLVGEGSSWDVHMFCNNQNPTVLIGGDVPSGTVGVVLDASLETTAGSAGINYRFGGSNYLPYFVFVDAPSGSDEARACFFLTNVPGAVEAQFDCEHVTRAATVPDQFRFATGSGSSNMVGELRNISFIVEGPDPNPPGPGPDDFQGWIGPAYTCVLTTTLNITDTSGLNFTHTVQYERPANFLRNADFEEPEGNKARYWTPVVNGTGNLDIPNHYLITLNPDTGKQDRVLVDIQEYGYWQGNWLGGKQFTALFGAEANGSGVSILYDSITVATSVYDTLTYFVPFSGTQAVGGGAPFFRIEFPGLNGQTWVDNAFLYPWDEETETVLCDPELFDPYDQEIDGTSGLQDAMLVGGVPAPIAGAGSVCYVCFTPSQIGANAVSLWIAWLGCVLRNMFSCSLRVWLLALGNWTFGLIQWLSALALWIPAEVQNGATWYMRDVVPGLAANVTIVQDGGSNLADVIIAFLALLASLISSLASLTVSVVEFLLSFVQMLQGAINPEPYEFGLDETAPGMSGAGATDAKRLWLFLIGFAVLDQLIMQYPEISGLLMVVTGAAVLGVVYWSFRWWREFINF